ncbi:MAG: hypothetical protein QOI20_3301 [Acidimicrobiaceae bacterium]|jgi:hypothetical protein|nr:hypothetical protein [Acidimicrobiaceae bacterium]
MRKLLEEIQTGTRVVAGTEWPIVDQLHRTGEREWTVTRDLCNGVPRTAETYRSETKAREAFEQRLDGRKPRTGVASKPITFKASDAERARWEAAAGRAGLSLSEWLRAAADRAAE